MNRYKNNIVLSRNGKIKISDGNNEKYSSNIPFGSKILVKALTNISASLQSTETLKFLMLINSGFGFCGLDSYKIIKAASLHNFGKRKSVVLK